ncbi:hypothetical protein T02_11122 [Trichinella nativa]|uniref:Uncharacterized protein n=1 Tax=Trichinella nativa TaxID=6335 RepID=A0A0V1KHH2_9BILA|nr:hypothetical protein T02_11122 [Trichinella nativa]
MLNNKNVAVLLMVVSTNKDSLIFFSESEVV